MTSYVNAPATKLLATKCACCTRPLVDAVSIEVGIGPKCRKDHGYDFNVDDEAHQEANVIVHRIAAKRYGHDVDADTARLRELGFVELAAKIEDRLEKAAERATKITIEVDGDVMVVVTPYKRSRSDEMVATLRKIRGRRWDRDLGANTFPADKATKKAVWAFLKEFYPGQLGTGPQGVFEIPKAA